MFEFNTVRISGPLAADPERFTSDQGTAVAKLRVAVHRATRRDEQHADVDLIDVVVWGEQAEQAARDLAEGSRLSVTGHLEQRTWNTPQGTASRLQVVADQVSVADQVEVIVAVDGGCRGNPGPAGYGVVVTTPGGEVLAELAKGIGWGTNNLAEYRAVIAGLEHARTLGVDVVRVCSDAKLVVKQLTGAWQINTPTLRPLHARAMELAGEFDTVTFEQVPRADNARADALADKAMNEQGPVADPATSAPAPAATAS